MVGVGLASTEGADATIWETTAAILAPLTVLCAASAAGTLALARRAQNRDRMDVGGVISDAELEEVRAPRQVGMGGSSLSTAERSRTPVRSDE
jgi:hypothetical protein